MIPYILFVALARLAGSQVAPERHRPQFHFSAPSGWMNDPNGLVFFDGHYHLFYQHNPNDTVWGPMYWGHARSKDLVNWEDLPIALSPTHLGTAFSGSAIVDIENRTQLSKDAANPPLVALYTVAQLDPQQQQQALAFSYDGINFMQYEKNPVLENWRNSTSFLLDFRDPSVFFHGGQAKMALAVNDSIRFYESDDLLNWRFISSFGTNPNQGDKGGQWECPSVNVLKDEEGNDHHVLIVSMNPTYRGSATQYYIGQFDGTRFINDNAPDVVLWNDFGPDNYAAIPFSNDPLNRTVLIGWMSNWAYANVTPTENFRGQMTVPRNAGLKRVDGRLRMWQYPVDEINVLRQALSAYSSPAVTLRLTDEISMSTLSNLNSSLLDIEAIFELNSASTGQIGIRFENSLGEFVTAAYLVDEKKMQIIRSRSGNVNLSSNWEKETKFDRFATSQRLSMRILLDVSAIEVFFDGGLSILTAIFFPNEYLTTVKVFSENVDKDIHLSNFTMFPLRPAGRSTFPDGSAVTTAGPNGSATTAGPNESATTAGPNESATTAGPNESATTAGPNGSATTAGILWIVFLSVTSSVLLR